MSRAALREQKRLESAAAPARVRSQVQQQVDERRWREYLARTLPGGEVAKALEAERQAALEKAATTSDMRAAAQADKYIATLSSEVEPDAHEDQPPPNWQPPRTPEEAVRQYVQSGSVNGRSNTRRGNKK